MRKSKVYIQNIEVKSFDASFLFWCLLACLSVTLVLVISIVTLFTINNLKISDITKTAETIELSNNNFVETIIKNSKMKIRNNYYISSKITLGESEIKELGNAGDLTFYGSLDGKGNTIEVECPMTKPIFSQISEGSTVKQLVIDNAKVSNKYATSLAVLTSINKGTIEFVKLSNAQISTSGISVAGGIAAYNRNEIKYCVASVFFEIDNEYTNPNQPGMSTNWKCYVGAAAGINSGDGQVKGAIISTNFSENFVVLTRQQTKNDMVGYAVGSWEKEKSISDVHIIDAQYVTTAHDIKMLYDTDRENCLQLKSLDKLEAVNFTNGDWNNSLYGWNFKSGALPILKTSQALEG